MRPVLANALLLHVCSFAGLTWSRPWRQSRSSLLSAGNSKDKRVLRYQLKVGNGADSSDDYDVRIENPAMPKPMVQEELNQAQGDRELKAKDGSWRLEHKRPHRCFDNSRGLERLRSKLRMTPSATSKF